MVLKKMKPRARIGTKIKPGAGRVGIWACTWGSAQVKDGTKDRVAGRPARLNTNPGVQRRVIKKRSR